MRIDSIKFARPFYQKLRGRVQKHYFEVGILEGNKPHKNPLPKTKGLSTYAGGPRRKLGRKSDLKMKEVSAQARINTGINYLKEPFKQKDKAVYKLLDQFFKVVRDPNSASKKKRFINTVQAVVRNPILKKEYGPNSRIWAKEKGFNRKFIDTAQLFKNIKARLVRRWF